MRGRSPGAILSAYLDALGNALACLKSVHVQGQRFLGPGLPHSLSINAGQPLELESSEFGRVALRIRQRYTFESDNGLPVAERWRLAVIDYAYTLLPKPERGAGEAEELSYDETRALMAFH